MSTLRKQMEADMAIRALAYRTREAYVGSVAKLAQHYRRSPDRISEAEVQRYLLYLLEERKLAHSSVNIACSGLEFFYRVTMKRREAEFCLPRPKVPSKLPQILSREEVAALFEHTTNQKHRAFLMTTYAAGLRLSEACHLKVSDIDSDRMTIRVEQGKGAKDRYTPLSPRLLGELRRYWASYQPKLWLFPGMRDAQGPLLPKSAQRIFYAAKERAGITKRCGIHGLRHAFATHSLVRRFLLHVLPRGFMRIRHYGLLANRIKHIKLAAARAALEQPPPAAPPPLPEAVAAFWLRIAALDIHQCPRCRAGRMRIVTTLMPLMARPPPAPRIA